MMWCENKTRAFKCMVLAGVSLVGLANAGGAWAQETETSGAVDERMTETVYISARRVEETIQEAPLSVSVFGAEEIEAMGLDDLTEIARSTPGFSFENFNGAFGTPVIRGQSQNRLTNPVQNVATFYNGVALPRGYMVDASLLNIGQVEILRGPQSAALGRNAYAGAVNFISKSPDEEFGGRIAASMGENEFERYDITAEGFLIPGVLGLIGGFSTGEYDGAWANNHALADAPGARTKGNLGGYEYDSWMLGAELTPVDGLVLKATYLSSERDIENTGQYSISGTALYAVNTLNCSPNGLGANQLYCGTLPVSPVIAPGETRKPGLVIDPRTGLSLASDIFTFEASYDLTDTLDVSYLYGKIDGDFTGAGSSGRDQEVGYNGPSAPFLGLAGRNLIDTSGNGNITADSHEVRLAWKPSDNLQGYVGGFYSTSDDVTKFALISVPAQTVGPLDPGIVLNFPGFAANSVNAREITSFFGLVEYSAGPWTVSAEGRFTEEEVTETNLFTTPSTSASETFDYFTPRLTATYALTDTNRIYVSYARGTKAGGFNAGGSAPSTFADPSQATFAPEENDTFEIGSRNELLDGRFILNGTLFYIDATDIQVNVPRIGSTGNVIGNRAAAETWGFELEADFDVSDRLNLFAGLGYANAEYGDNTFDITDATRCFAPVCVAVPDPSNPARLAVDISGNRLERAPSVTFNTGWRWHDSLTPNIDYFIRGNVAYQDSQYSNSINTAEVPSRTIADAAIGLNRSGLSLTLSADNLFDEQYVASVFETGFLQTYTPNLGDRRRVVVTLAYDF